MKNMKILSILFRTLLFIPITLASCNNSTLDIEDQDIISSLIKHGKNGCNGQNGQNGQNGENGGNGGDSEWGCGGDGGNGGDAD